MVVMALFADGGGGGGSQIQMQNGVVFFNYTVNNLHISSDKKGPKMHICRNGTEMAELKGIKNAFVHF